MSLNAYLLPPSADHNIFNLIIISAAIYGFFFAFVVLTSKKFRSPTNKYLAYVVLVMSISNTYNWFLDTRMFRVLEWDYYGLFYVYWDLLLLPLFLSFVASYLNQTSKSKAWYNYPFYFSLVISILIFALEMLSQGWYREHREWIRSYDRVFNYVTNAAILFVVYQTYVMIKDYDRRKIMDAIEVPLQTKWLKQLLYVAAVLCLVSLTMLLLDQFMFNYQLSIRQIYYFIWICMSLVIYWLGFLGVYHVGIFNQRKEIRSVENTGHKSAQTPKLKPERFEEMDRMVKNEKLYLNPLLNLSILAEKFDLSEGYVSQHINSYTKGNFANYVNSLRVEEAKRLLKEDAYAQFTIVAIGLESGFNSKTSFYNAFKKHTGKSPVQYRSH